MFSRLKVDSGGRHGNMDDWKQTLNFEFSSLMKNPVVAFLYALAHSLELVILFFWKQLKQILTNSFLTG